MNCAKSAPSPVPQLVYLSHLLFSPPSSVIASFEQLQSYSLIISIIVGREKTDHTLRCKIAGTDLEREVFYDKYPHSQPTPSPLHFVERKPGFVLYVKMAARGTVAAVTQAYRTNPLLLKRRVKSSDVHRQTNIIPSTAKEVARGGKRSSTPPPTRKRIETHFRPRRILWESVFIYCGGLEPCNNHLLFYIP